MLENLSRGILGMFFLVFISWLISNNKKAINWRLVGMGIFGQIMFAVGVLNTKIYGQPVFWILFGAIILYTISNKLRRRPNNQGENK